MLATISDYKTGAVLDTNVEVDAAAYTRDAQWPEGIIRAGDLLSDYQVKTIASENPGFSADTTIFVERKATR